MNEEIEKLILAYHFQNTDLCAEDEIQFVLPTLYSLLKRELT